MYVCRSATRTSEAEAAWRREFLCPSRRLSQLKFQATASTSLVLNFIILRGGCSGGTGIDPENHKYALRRALSGVRAGAPLAEENSKKWLEGFRAALTFVR